MNALRIRPGMFQAFDEGPDGLIERRRNAGFVAPLRYRPVHEIGFGEPARLDILQHAGLVLAWGAGPFLHELAGIAVQLNTELPRYRDPFFDQRVEELARRSKFRSRPVMQPS